MLKGILKIKIRDKTTRALINTVKLTCLEVCLTIKQKHACATWIPTANIQDQVLQMGFLSQTPTVKLWLSKSQNITFYEFDKLKTN